jgi:hypothetical protein
MSKFGKTKIFITAMAAALLAACGGGGGGGTVTNAVAEGVWSGTTSTNYALQAVVLENGDFYAIFGTSSNGVFSVYGFDQGAAAISGSTLSGALKEYYYNGNTYSSALSATVVNGTSMTGTNTWSDNSKTTWAVTPIASSTYVYNRAANLSEVSGSWTGTLLNGSSTTITIGSTGVVAGTNGSCTFTGSAAPRNSGKNIFNVSLTFGGAPCALPNQTVSGIGLDYLATNGKTQLIVALQDSSKVNGSMFLAQR